MYTLLIADDSGIVRRNIENAVGQPYFKATRRMNDAHQIEQVGEKLRGMMPWIGAAKMVDKSRN